MVTNNKLRRFDARRDGVRYISRHIWTLPILIVLEYVGVRYRTLVGNMAIAIYFGGGCLLLPWLAYGIANWRLFSIISAVPMFLVVFAPFIIPESARWLTTKGRTDDAVKILKKFERINGTNIPDDVLEKYVVACKNDKTNEKGLLTLFRSSTLRVIVLLLVICMMCVALAFDCLIRMSENLGLNFFVTFTVTSATEIPSIILLVILMDRFGRRLLFLGPMIMICALSLGAAFVHGDISSVVLVTCARFFSNMGYNVMIQWTPELVPTMVRASGTALVQTLAAAAIIVSPFVVYTYRIWSGLPVAVVAVAALVGACMEMLLPETAGQPMPQTVEDVKAFRKRNMVFSSD